MKETEAELFELLSENKGKDKVIIYLVKEKQSKMLPAMYRVVVLVLSVLNVPLTSSVY